MFAHVRGRVYMFNRCYEYTHRGSRRPDGDITIKWLNYINTNIKLNRQKGKSMKYFMQQILDQNAQHCNPMYRNQMFKQNKQYGTEQSTDIGTNFLNRTKRVLLNFENATYWGGRTQTIQWECQMFGSSIQIHPPVKLISLYPIKLNIVCKA